MKPLKSFCILVVSLGMLSTNQAQELQNIAQRLGYEKDAKLLIIHADDIGLAQSVNNASIKAFNSGGITSGSIMVPCPWFTDFAHYYQAHPDLDVGIHITLTAEWETYKWDGVLPATEISTLLDQQGHLYPSVEEVGSHADPSEAEKEIRAQIERALAFGIKPTHLDTHMGSVGASPQLMQTYLKMGKEYGIPLLIPRFWILSLPEQMRTMIEQDNVLLDGLFMLNAAPEGGSWGDAYEKMVQRIGPGLNQLIVHLANDNEEMQAIAVNHPDFGAAWRQNDLDLVTSKEFQDMLKANDIQLVSWKEIKSVM